MRRIALASLLILTACSGSSSTNPTTGSSGGTTTGSSGGSSGGGGSTGGSGAKRIFVTAASYSADLGGVAGADQKCNTSAQAQNLGGTWVAIISDAQTNCFDRIADVGPWVDLHGNVIFNNKAGLSTVPLRAIDTTEQGTTLQRIPTNVWTGIKTGGQAALDCAHWTSISDTSTAEVGNGVDTSNWIDLNTSDACSNTHPIYCIEQ